MAQDVPTDAARVAESIGHIRPSKDDTCETQRQVAEQSSRIDTIRTGKEVVYAADCLPKKPDVARQEKVAS